MSFTSFEFLAFVALLAVLYRICPVALRSVFLILASYAFYCLTSPKAAVALFLSSTITYAAALSISEYRESRVAQPIAVGTVLALACYLVFFKVIVLLPGHGLASIAIPLGISYYTFKLISYVLDVYWGKIEAERSLVRFAGYVAFFPQIVAGPIQRADDYLKQRPHPGRVHWAIARIFWGLFKKLLIADNLAPTVNYIFNHTGRLHGAPLWIGFYLWPLQLYADFSGLTDIALGAGQLFGIKGPENFSRPFTASNISEYWRRWHMSLTNWLSDYVFTPLRMSTRKYGKIGLAVSIAVNMIAIGLWHGIAWTYLVFGCVHTIFLILDAFSARWRKRWFKQHQRWDSVGSWLGWLVTFHLVAFALVFFRVRAVSDALGLLRGMWSGLDTFTVNMPQIAESQHALALGLAGYMVLEACERWRPDQWYRHKLPVAPRFIRWSFYSGATLILLVGVLLLLTFGGRAGNPFVYAVF